MNLDTKLENEPVFEELVYGLCSSQIDALNESLALDAEFMGLFEQFQNNEPDTAIDATKSFPDESLGDWHKKFMDFHGFTSGFFENFFNKELMTEPADFLLYRIAVLHDLIHVIAEYETSDIDELRIQSFCLGLEPNASLLFLKLIKENELIAGREFKHLKDVYKGKVSYADFKRGQKCRAILRSNIDQQLNRPIQDIRTDYQVEKITYLDPQIHINSCGGREDVFFKLFQANTI